MTHGRDHGERQYKAEKPRHNNVPEAGEADVEMEADMAEAGRDQVHPHEPRAPMEARGGHGSEPAPTKQAAERERERHARERDKGHFAAGTEGRRRAMRADDVSREDLEESAREADRSVAGRDLPGAGGHREGMQAGSDRSDRFVEED